MKTLNKAIQESGNRVAFPDLKNLKRIPFDSNQCKEAYEYLNRYITLSTSNTDFVDRALVIKMFETNKFFLDCQTSMYPSAWQRVNYVSPDGKESSAYIVYSCDLIDFDRYEIVQKKLKPILVEKKDPMWDSWTAALDIKFVRDLCPSTIKMPVILDKSKTMVDFKLHIEKKLGTYRAIYYNYSMNVYALEPSEWVDAKLSNLYAKLWIYFQTKAVRDIPVYRMSSKKPVRKSA